MKQIQAQTRAEVRRPEDEAMSEHKKDSNKKVEDAEKLVQDIDELLSELAKEMEQE